MYSFQKIIRIGIVTTIGGLNLIVYATPAITHEEDLLQRIKTSQEHSSPAIPHGEDSSPSRTSPKHQSPPRTTKIRSLTPREREAERF